MPLRWIDEHPNAGALAAAILALVLYAITLKGTFIWDDRFIAQNDPRLHDPAGWKLYWLEAYRPNAVDNLWRPLTSLTYWLQWRMGGTPWTLHAVNILLHAGASAMVALLATRLAGARTGLVAGLLFAAHPVHVEGVAYIVGRAESLCALFAMGAMFLTAKRPMTTPRAFAVFTCALASALSKEQGLLVPLALLAVGLLMRVRAGPIERPERQAFITLLVLILWTWSAYVYYRDRMFGWYWDPYFLDWSINPASRATGIDRWLIPISLAGRAATLLVAPWRLSPDYGAAVTMPHVHWSDPYLWAGCLAILAYIAGWIYAWRRRDGFVAFCLFALALAWLPVANFSRIGTIFGERLLYLPSIFFVMLIGGLASKTRPRALTPLLLIVLTLLSVRTVTYAHRWNDRERFYEISLAEQPDSAQLHILLADELQAHARDANVRGDPDAERALLLRADQILADARRRIPDYYKVWTESAETSFNLGRIDEAYQFVRRAEALEPGQPVIGYWDEQIERKRATTKPATRPSP